MPLSTLKQQQKNAAAKHTDGAEQGSPSNGLILDFFKVKKDTDSNFRDVQILQTGFLALLRRLGFRRYDEGDSFIIVRIDNNIIEQIPLFRLREMVVRYFKNLPDDVDDICPLDALLEKLHRSLGTLTTDEKLALLVPMDEDGAREIKIVEDTIDTAFYFYQNGFIEVTKNGYQLRPYTELPGMIWKDQIIPRQFEILKPSEVENGVYWKFANNVAGNAKGDHPERFTSFLTITGYNLHRFFNTKLRCTIFLDSRMGDDPDGRSGKSLHCKAIREILNADPQNGKQMITIDGKKYDPQNRFNLDQLHISTRLVLFDDIKRGFQIEEFFNAIVDGLIRERKGDVNKARIFAKILFTLNYTIQIRGGSAKDRVIEFEFADHYSSQYTPEQEFKMWFFRDWDTAEYSRFDNFMMMCVVDYLKMGVIMPDTVNLEARKLREETAQEFINFMEDQQIEHEKAYDKKELWGKFVQVGDDGKPRYKDFDWLKQREFTNWLRRFAIYRPEYAGIREFRSNGRDLIRFFENAPVTAEFLDGANLFAGKSDKCVPAAGSGTDKDLPF